MEVKLERRLGDEREAAEWEAAASDLAFRGEAGDVETAYRECRSRDVAGLTRPFRSSANGAR
jgi:hypothetical protein